MQLQANKVPKRGGNVVRGMFPSISHRIGVAAPKMMNSRMLHLQNQCSEKEEEGQC